MKYKDILLYIRLALYTLMFVILISFKGLRKKLNSQLFMIYSVLQILFIALKLFRVESLIVLMIKVTTNVWLAILFFDYIWAIK